MTSEETCRKLLATLEREKSEINAELDRIMMRRAELILRQMEVKKAIYEIKGSGFNDY